MAKLQHDNPLQGHTLHGNTGDPRILHNHVLHGPVGEPTILIVDDVDLNRHLMRAILKTSNYRILEAKRPSAALAQLEREKVDLVVVDLVMPGMSGDRKSVV